MPQAHLLERGCSLLQVRSGKAGGFMQELDAETVQFCNSVMLDLLPPELNAIFGVQ
jgi:hypothetical protein